MMDSQDNSGCKRTITSKKILEQLPGPYRIGEDALSVILGNQIQDGSIYEWPAWRSKKKILDTAPEPYILKSILKVLSHKALTRSELRKN